jgi:hypothetical protein
MFYDSVTYILFRKGVYHYSGMLPFVCTGIASGLNQTNLYCTRYCTLTVYVSLAHLSVIVAPTKIQQIIKQVKHVLRVTQNTSVIVHPLCVHHYRYYYDY